MESDIMTEQELERISQIMKAVAHPTRMKILFLLSKDLNNVNELVKALGVNQALVSQQLRILRLNNLVKTEKKNGFVYYSLDPDKKKYINKMIECIYNI
ncbi:MAG: metalloregulator ArsR/SmtB family transcription factor [bacterium]